MISRDVLKRFFEQFAASRPLIPRSVGNMYEFYIFLVVCQEARRVGFIVRLNPNSGDFLFRSSPGFLGGAFGYANFQSVRGQKYELHSGVQFPGHSGMTHEADISLIRANSLLDVKRGEYALLIECKNYRSPKNLKGEARKMIGLVVDRSQKFHKSQLTGLSQGCINCGAGFDSYFVTNIAKTLRSDIQEFLATYNIQPAFGVHAGALGLSDFTKQLQKTFAALI